jgi:hypothetical protein
MSATALRILKVIIFVIHIQTQQQSATGSPPPRREDWQCESFHSDPTSLPSTLIACWSHCFEEQSQGLEFRDAFIGPLALTD